MELNDKLKLAMRAGAHAILIGNVCDKDFVYHGNPYKETISFMDAAKLLELVADGINIDDVDDYEFNIIKDSSKKEFKRSNDTIEESIKVDDVWEVKWWRKK